MGRWEGETHHEGHEGHEGGISAERGRALSGRESRRPWLADAPGPEPPALPGGEYIYPQITQITQIPEKNARSHESLCERGKSHHEGHEGRRPGPLGQLTRREATGMNAERP